jgi:hypothetical protein
LFSSSVFGLSIRASARLVAALTGLLLMGALPARSTWVADAHAGACSRIEVDSRDRGILTSRYVVSDPDYVARKHSQIDQNGQDGAWTVEAGDLGPLGYTVTYICLP